MFHFPWQPIGAGMQLPVRRSQIVGTPRCQLPDIPIGSIWIGYTSVQDEIHLGTQIQVLVPTGDARQGINMSRKIMSVLHLGGVNRYEREQIRNDTDLLRPFINKQGDKRAAHVVLPIEKPTLPTLQKGSGACSGTGRSCRIGSR